MDLLQSIILGIIQGITEFLPISSTAHLILVPALLGWTLDEQSVFIFDILLQFGTVISVVIYFWRDLWGIARAVVTGLIARRPFETAEARLGWIIVVGTVPAVVIALLARDAVEGLHGQPLIVATIMGVAAALIFVSERIGRRDRAIETLDWKDGLIIGAFQALALFPGVSRSAATICGGLVRGLERRAAARFSFLLMVPALTGASVIAVKDLLETPNFAQYLPPLALGTAVSLVVGLACIHWLLGFLARQSMAVFGWYRIGFSILCVAFLGLSFA
ncbi:MAG TPA: undecaprenyl-diphosphatase UppP [Anaerolineales bacterium]|nr:undecaprenyl-diphosphatase UppP [Anaerolineales bacterium]